MKKGSELGAPGDLYRYISESSRSLKPMQKKQNHGNGVKYGFY
jgi:hypothetical protein